MDFGDALLMLKDGEKVARQAWLGSGAYLFLAAADFGTHPQIMSMLASGDEMPWITGHRDALHDDWEVLK